MSKIIKLHYFDTYEIFQGNKRFTKLGFEVEIDEEHDNVRDCYYQLKRKSEELFYESKGADEKQKKQEEEKPPTLTKVVDIIKEINFCKDAETLVRVYKYAAKVDPDSEAAYNKKLKSLS